MISTVTSSLEPAPSNPTNKNTTLCCPPTKMGFWTLTTLVTGNLIGSGAFMLPLSLAAFGSLCIIGWVSTSIGAIILSLIFAALSATITSTGGPHTYVEKAFGRSAGFFTAWSYWVLSWISNAGLVVGAIGYISPLFGGFDLTTIFILEVGLLLFLSAVNLAGVHLAGKFEILLTLCKVVPLIGLPLIAIFYINPEHFTPFNGSEHSTYTAINMTAYMTLWCFIGLESGTVPGSEVENPKKTIPRAIIVGTSLAALVYILGTIAIIGVVPKAQLIASKAPYADLAGVIFGGSWSASVGILASIACIGALNGWIMIVSRIASGAAKDGLFPAVFKTTTKSGAPLWGTVISTVCTIPFMALSLSENLMNQFTFILDFSVVLVLIIYLSCVFAYFSIMKKNKILTKKALLLGVLGGLFCAWTLTQVHYQMLLASISIIAIGLPVWLWTRKQSEQK